MVGASPEDAWVRPADQYNFAAADAAIAATSMMLEGTNLGLGATSVGHFNPGKLKDAFPRMDSSLLIAIFGVSQPEKNAEPHPLHFQRKGQEEIAEYL